MKTLIPTEKDFDKKIYLIDAQGKTLGRLATKVASLLLGKGKSVYCYDKICGDQVVVINAAKVYTTGNKKQRKVYTHYTGHPSGLRSYNLETLLEKKPEEVIRRAVSGMLPKNHRGKKIMTHLRIYAGAEHKQQSQKPISLEV